MYCINCGVKLADTESRCPLCQTVVYHPDLERKKGESLYPENQSPRIRRSLIPQVALTVIFVMSALISFLCDMQFNHTVGWSGFVMGGLLCGYITFILPMWFKRPSPAVFVPCSFLILGGYLLYISLVTRGGWFLSFAFPVTGGTGLIVTALAVLLYYTKGAEFIIVGAASILFGAFMMLVEFFLNITFGFQRFVWWSLYPLTALSLIGIFLIFLGINKTARQAMKRRFFI